MITSTILSMITGGIAPFIGKLLGIWQDKTDKSHELAMRKLDIEAQKEIAQVQSTEHQLIEGIKAQSIQTGIKWVDAINSLVRPLVTYCFFFLFLLVTITTLVVTISEVLKGSISLKEALPLVWTEPINCMFSGIMSFWFSDRVLLKK